MNKKIKMNYVFGIFEMGLLKLLEQIKNVILDMLTIESEIIK
jgi:hypothetical protein